jgi:CRISPR-associated protein Cmr1
LSGADARGAPELRPPAFRGALRYWLRAALAEPNLEKLHEAESAVFGSAANEGDDSQRGHASAVTVRISPLDIPEPKPFDQRINPNTGYGYLYWSLTKMGDLGPKQYYPPPTRFNLTLATRQPDNVNREAVLQKAVAALWLLIHLGGAGARSRRMAGNFKLIQANNDYPDLAFLPPLATENELIARLQSGLKTIRAIFGNPSPSHVQYDAIAPQCAQIWVLGTWSSVKEAQEAIGMAIKEGRRGTSRSQRALFGLPTPNIGPWLNNLKDKPPFDRRASPIWLQVSALQNGKCSVVATLFKSQFLPDGQHLKVSYRDQNNQRHIDKVAAPIDYQPIEAWLGQHGKKVFPSLSEVTDA